MSSVQSHFAQPRVRKFLIDTNSTTNLYTLAQIQTAFAPYSPSYIGSIISFNSSTSFTSAWIALEGLPGVVGSSTPNETFKNLGKQLKVGFGGYSDIITLTLVQRTSKGLLDANGVPNGGTNGYGTYYIVTESSANENGSAFDGYAEVHVSAT